MQEPSTVAGDDQPTPPPTRQVRGDIRPRLDDQQKALRPSTSSERGKAAKPRPKLRYTVTFFTKSSVPAGLPSFPYAVLRTVMGHAQVSAYVFAVDEYNANDLVNQYFDVAATEVIERGFTHIHRYRDELRGVVTQEHVGLWPWLRKIFGVSHG